LHRGFVKLWIRSLESAPFTRSARHAGLSTMCLLMAGRHRHGGVDSRGDVCRPGQFTTTWNDLALLTRESTKSVRRLAADLKRCGFCTWESRQNRWLLFTILNWSVYQNHTAGQTEGQTGGSTAGQTEGQTGGSTAGQTGATPKALVPACLQNTAPPNGQTEGQTGGSTAGQTEGQTGGSTAGQTKPFSPLHPPLCIQREKTQTPLTPLGGDVVVFEEHEIAVGDGDEAAAQVYSTVFSKVRKRSVGSVMLPTVERALARARIGGIESQMQAELLLWLKDNHGRVGVPRLPPPGRLQSMDNLVEWFDQLADARERSRDARRLEQSRQPASLLLDCSEKQYRDDGGKF